MHAHLEYKRRTETACELKSARSGTGEDREMMRRAQMQRPHPVGNQQDAPLGSVDPHQYFTEHGEDKECLQPHIHKLMSYIHTVHA
jgi:hypothetical protein